MLINDTSRRENQLSEKPDTQKSSMSGILVVGAWLSVIFILVIIYSEYLSEQRHPNTLVAPVSSKKVTSLPLIKPSTM